MVVEDIASIPPKYRQSIDFHPNDHPTVIPITIIQKMMEQAAMIAVPPTFISFLKLNSNPKAKSKKITPISDHVWILAVSMTEGVSAK
jgi:hypothetical protein